MKVTASIEPRIIPTYPVGTPEKNPVFFEKRVYQGSNGKVYPVPFIDKVYDDPQDVSYQSVRLENEFVRLVMLPEIGGRIFIGQDKTNKDYDFFYRQDVIKPALVGLAGPWISGGVEFNWPQHHRPGTFMPADVHVEEEEDGARTVWMSEHDPIHRLKGMHGIRLRPGSSLIELRARLCNRTPLTRTFLWWANVAAMVHDQYQSFFPPDVRYVADHAVRAMSSFPQAHNAYYGVDYRGRPGADDLSWYKNIPVPTSYMVCQTNFDFFGGYDYAAKGGFVHVANRHISPGKKQWTWGNHPFGWAWDRELTDTNGPYIELMAGVYTDNQPDFSYLAPYETKTFSQFWWPIQGIGPVQQANELAALHMQVRDDHTVDLGLCVSRAIRGAKLIIARGGDVLMEKSLSLKPGEAWKNTELKLAGEPEYGLLAMLFDADDHCILNYRPVDASALERTREVATEPPAPVDIASADELYFTGEHLEQYRHPTRSPEDYWQEALRRDSGDARCHIAMGRRALNTGCLEEAADHFHQAIQRLTSRHPNPETGEAHYFLGITLVYQGEFEAAYPVLYKATWTNAWRAAAYYQIACLDCRKNAFGTALEHLDAALATNADHTKAMVLQAIVLRHTGDNDEAADILDDVLAVDPLDHWARWEAVGCGSAKEKVFFQSCRNDAQTILDIAFDYADAGFGDEAIALLENHLARPVADCAVPNPLSRTPMVLYMLAWLKDDATILAAARAQSPDWFFPSRLHEQIVLEWALAQSGTDPVAAYALGNQWYDALRHEEALAMWERSIADGAGFATVFRNLGIAMWNVRRDGTRARECFRKALGIDSTDPRLVSEYDQLCAKLNDPLADRLAFLVAREPLVLQRDDCTVAMASMFNLTGDPQRALQIMTSRRFHPWEGGEGSVLREYTAARIALGRVALAAGDATAALAHFQGAMDTPESLGEAYHLLQAKADVWYWTGMAMRALGREQDALAEFERCAREAGDFASMAVTAFSPLTWYRGQAMKELGMHDEARELFAAMKEHALAALAETARIDYFATSLPNLLVFDEDMQGRKDSENNLLLALACHGLGEIDVARAALLAVEGFTNANPLAAELHRVLDGTAQ